MKKKILFVALILLFAAFLGACSSEDPETALVGTWECRDASIPHRWLCNLTFYENGMFTDRDGDSGSFTINGNSLTFNFDDFDPFIVTFNLSRNRLTLTADDLRVVLNRQ